MTSKVRISYVTQRNNTFLFLCDLFSEFTSELCLFLKEVTLISFFFSFFFILFSEFTKLCGSSLRSKRFRSVSGQRNAEEGDFRF